MGIFLLSRTAEGCGRMCVNKIKVGFLGYGTRALDALMEHDGYEVGVFLAPVSRLCADIYDARKRFPDLEFGYVRNNDEVLAAFEKAKASGITCFVMNACPIILNDAVLKAMPVYNIHPGDIHYNRGHQPHMWTVLLGDSSSEIILHSVTVGIDEGNIIACRDMAVTEDMDCLDVLDGLEDMIPELLDGLYDHLMKGTAPIATVCGGGYRPVMTYEDYMFDPADMDKPDFIRDVSRKIRARVMNHGAFFIYDGERVYVDRLLCDEQIATSDPSDLVSVTFNGSVVFVQKGSRRLVFNLCKREKAVDTK